MMMTMTMMKKKALMMKISKKIKTMRKFAMLKIFLIQCPLISTIHPTGSQSIPQRR